MCVELLAGLRYSGKCPNAAKLRTRGSGKNIRNHRFYTRDAEKRCFLSPVRTQRTLHKPQLGFPCIGAVRPAIPGPAQSGNSRQAPCIVSLLYPTLIIPSLAPPFSRQACAKHSIHPKPNPNLVQSNPIKESWGPAVCRT